MNLTENNKRVKQLMGLLKETNQGENNLNLVGKVIDLDNMSDDEKNDLQLKEKIVVDSNKKDYPILLVQKRDGSVVMFDINGIETEFSEENL